MRLSFWEQAEQRPDDLAVVTPEGREVKAGELLDMCSRIEAVLAGVGLRPGNTVALLLPNSAEIVAASLAGLRSGLHVVPINTHLAQEEIRFILLDSDSGALLAAARYGDVAGAVADPLPAQARISVDGPIPGFTQVASAPRGQPDRGRAGRLLLYTSGTTGNPRGVRRRPLERTAEEEAVPEALRLFSRFEARPNVHDGPHLVGGPMYHAQPLLFAINALQLGQPLVLMDRWDSELALQLIERYQAVSMAVVPTMLNRLLQLPDEVRLGYDCSSLRRVIHAGAPCPAETKRRVIAWWGPIVDEYYAATEGGGTSITSREWLQRPGSVGRAYPGAAVRILDEDDHPCAPGVPGRVFMKLLLPFDYHKDPAKTAAGRRDDYFTVGDIGYLDEDGYLFLVDRASDIIISGGVNIYPAEVEAALLESAMVADAAVIGVPDPEWGESVHAIVQAAAGAAAGDGLAADLVEFCRARLAHFKCPRTIEFVRELPRLESGKVQRRKLRDERWQGRPTRI
jgi:long-chain acyl-CoA synthetase